MDPVTLTLMAANMGGGLMGALGKKKAKSIDPEWLKKHFGAAQVNDEMVRLFNHILSGPVGQQLMTNAAQQGQQFQTDQARMAARAGFGPTGGADSGASIFSGAAAGGATNAMQRDVKSNIMNNSIGTAQQMVRDRMNIAANSEQNRLQNDFEQPSTLQSLGGMLARGANAAMYSQAEPTTNATPGLMSGGTKLTSVPQNLLQPGGALAQGGAGIGWGVDPTMATYKKRGFFSRLGNAISSPFSRLTRAGAN